MASSSLDLHLSVDQFHCSICLEVFTDPVTIPCGHTFCKTCITLCWDTRSHCQCPMCKNDFEKRPDLKINTLFSEMASQVKKQVLIVEQRPVAESGDVPCDVCIENKQKASKSCLVCLVSYCETHLEPHQVLTSFKRHKLVDPVENLENRICTKHERLLELFCKNDKTCLCQFCLLENDHKSHTVVSVDEECEERKVQLGKTEEQLQQMILERQQKVQEIRTSVKDSERNTQKEIADAVWIFTSVIRSIEKEQAKAIQRVEKRLKSVEKQAEETIKDLEEEVKVLQTRRSEVRMLSDTKDQLHLLKASTSTCTLPTTNTSPGNEVQGYRRVEIVQGTVRKLQNSLSKVLEKIELNMLKQYAVDVSLDPETCHPQLVVSEDCKQVECKDAQQHLSPNPKRFSNDWCVLGKEGFFSGRCYYEVEVAGSSAWALGVMHESVDRKSGIPWSPSRGVWAVGLSGGVLKAYDNRRVSLPLQELHVVGVFLDYENREVSFYNAEAGTHIHSFTQCTFKEKLFPFFWKYKQEGNPLIICTVSTTN